MKISLDLWSVLFGVGLCSSPFILGLVIYGFIELMNGQKRKEKKELEDKFVSVFVDRTGASEETPS